MISIVIPCYNEEEVIQTTHKILVETMTGLNDSFEVVYVNDGSRDNTLNLLLQLEQNDNRVRVVSFARNFGHQLAVTAGIDHAIGDAVVLIDADLQDPPAVILEMVQKWREGWDVVYGVRRSREGESGFKLATARSFYRFLNKISEVPIPLDTGDFRLMDRKVVEVLKSMPEKDRFVRGMVSWVGFKQTPLEYDRAKRFAGVTKYPLRKMLAFALDGVVSFSRKPLTLATKTGFAFAMIAILGVLYAAGMRIFTNNWVSGWTLMMITVLVIGAVQLICLGIIGEYVGRIYAQSKERPLYIVAYTTPVGEARQAESSRRGVPELL